MVKGNGKGYRNYWNKDDPELSMKDTVFRRRRPTKSDVYIAVTDPDVPGQPLTVRSSLTGPLPTKSDASLIGPVKEIISTTNSQAFLCFAASKTDLQVDKEVEHLAAKIGSHTVCFIPGTHAHLGVSLEEAKMGVSRLLLQAADPIEAFICVPKGIEMKCGFIRLESPEWQEMGMTWGGVQLMRSFFRRRQETIEDFEYAQSIGCVNRVIRSLWLRYLLSR